MKHSTKKITSTRQHQIIDAYKAALDEHLQAILTGEAEHMYEISEFAKLLHIHPAHLSNTVHEVLGVSPCNIFEHKILDIAKHMITNSTDSISQIARRLTYDPSNFTKFFKAYTGTTPKRFRDTQHQKI